MKNIKSLQSIILSEKLESPAQQQSQETYLIPRNCWLRITSLQIKPSQLDKNHKLRIRISVPNSARVVRTSSIQLDDSFLSILQNAQNQAGYSEMKLDIIVLLEYKHDVRIGHQNNLDFDVESLSPVISRSKTLGSAIIDLSQVLQNSMQTNLIFRKDNETTASINVEIYSLCLSKTSPPLQLINKSTRIFNSDSESESELPVVTAHFEKTISDLFKKNRLLILDDRTPQGHTLHQNTSMNDFVLPISDSQVIQLIFDIAEQEYLPSTKYPFIFIIAGDDLFSCNVLKHFISMRDKDCLSNDAFDFIHIPLVKDKSHLARKISFIYSKCNLITSVSNTHPNSNANNNTNSHHQHHHQSDSDSNSTSESSSSDSDSGSNSFDETESSDSGISSYSKHFLTDDWFNLFIENSSIQNASSVINSEVRYLTENPLSCVNLYLADVLISTMKSQFTVPMVSMLEIGKINGESKKSNAFQLKSTLITKDGTKNQTLKFNYMYILTIFDATLYATWMPVNNSSSTAKKKKKKGLTKVVLSLSKSHKEPLTVKIDDIEYNDILNLAIIPREAESALKLYIPTSKGKK